MRNDINILTAEPEGKRPLGRPMGRWKDTIKIKLGDEALDCVR
jgi:hypothetical protein